MSSTTEKKYDGYSNKPKQLVICLHGSGDTGEGFRKWIKHVIGNEFEETLDKKGIKVIFPSAIPKPYTMNGKKINSVWFDRIGIGPEYPEDTVGIDISKSLIEKHFEGFDEVSIVGLSQGGCLALHTGLTQRKNYPVIKSVVSLSGFLANNTKLLERLDLPFSCYESMPKVPPILMCHGTSDNIVNNVWGRNVSNYFNKKGLNCQWVEIPNLGHTINEDEIRKTLDFILDSFGYKLK